MRLIFEIGCVACAAAIAIARPSEAVVARFAGTSLVISDGAKRIELREITRIDVISRKVLAATKRGGDYFVVLTIRESSGRPADGYCGAGVEAYVKWVRVHDVKVVDFEETPFESCIDNREGKFIGWRGPLFVFETYDANERRRIRLAFDLQNPTDKIKEIREAAE